MPDIFSYLSGVKFECEHSQSFLIGRPIDRGTKPLTKYESVSCCRSHDHTGGAPVSSFTGTRFEDNADNIGHFRATRFIYRALTTIRKDCLHIGQERQQRASGVTRAGIHSRQLQ
jgi:hypothetical protein